MTYVMVIYDDLCQTKLMLKCFFAYQFVNLEKSNGLFYGQLRL